MNTISANKPNTSIASFPQAAWSSITIEAAESMTLCGENGFGYLEVTVHNRSTALLDPGEAGELFFAYRVLGKNGEILPSGGFRTPLKEPIAAGATHRQIVTVTLPPPGVEGAAAIRIGLVREHCYWVEQLNPDHPTTVAITRQGSQTRQDALFGAASQIWPRGKNNGMRWPYHTMMVSDRHKLMYIPVAKCACTSLKSMMVQLAEIERADIALQLDVHFVTDRFNTGIQLKDKSIDLAREILASDQYFKFSVIRDPFERLVSAYLEKFVYKRHSQRNLMHTRPVISAAQGTPDIDLERGISFDQFVEYILGQDPFDLDPHWRPQHLYFKGVRHINRIFRLDNIAELERYLLEHHDVTVKLGHKNRTIKSDIYLPEACTLPACEFDHRDAIKPDSFLASSHVEAIREYYREDFEFYGTSS